MAINYGTYGAGAGMVTTGDAYKEQEQLLGLEQLETAVEDGIDRGQAQVDRQRKQQFEDSAELRAQQQAIRAQESHDSIQTIRANQIAEHDRLLEQREKKLDVARKAILESHGILPEVENQKAYDESVQQDADIATKAPKKDIPGIYENGEWLADDETLLDMFKKGGQFRESMPANIELAANYLDSPDLDLVEAGEVGDVAEALQESGYKRGSYNASTGTYDAIVTTVDEKGNKKEVVIPGGNFEDYFGNAPTKFGIPQLIDKSAASIPALKALSLGKTITPREFEQALPQLAAEFDTQSKIDSFIRSVGQTPEVIAAQEDGVVTADEAAAIALGGLKGIYGKSIVSPPTGPQFSTAQVDAANRFYNFRLGDKNDLEELVDGVNILGVGKDEESGKDYLINKSGRKIYLSSDKAQRESQVQRTLGISQEALDFVTPKPKTGGAGTGTGAVTGTGGSTITLPDDPTQVNFGSGGGAANNATPAKTDNVKVEEQPTPKGNKKSGRYNILESRKTKTQEIINKLQLDEVDACQGGDSEGAKCKRIRQQLEGQMKDMERINSQLEEEDAKLSPVVKTQEEQIDDLLKDLS